MQTPEGIFSLRFLPSTPHGMGLLKAHIEAHDHLAVVTEVGAGVACVTGPLALSEEITAVCDELVAALGLLRVA